MHPKNLVSSDNRASTSCCKLVIKAKAYNCNVCSTISDGKTNFEGYSYLCIPLSGREWRAAVKQAFTAGICKCLDASISQSAMTTRE